MRAIGTWLGGHWRDLVVVALLLIFGALCWFPAARAFALTLPAMLGHALAYVGPTVLRWGWIAIGWAAAPVLLAAWLGRGWIGGRWQDFANGLDHFWGPRHPRRFRARIKWRVRWLGVRLWWRQPKFTRLRRHWPRPFAVLAAGIVIILLMRWEFLSQSDGFFGQLNRLLTGQVEDAAIGWKDAVQPLLLMVGLPVAFLLWLFRDIHVNETLENQRKDVNLKQFQDVQARAAGVMDEKLPKQARETSQIAAIHQLRPFLSGEFGESFRRPAWELLRARLVASAETTLTSTIAQSIDHWHEARAARERLSDEEREERDAPLSPSGIRREIRAALRERLNASLVSEAERAVVRDEWSTLFRSRLPLSDTCFDRIDLPVGALLASCDLSRCSFIGANLPAVRLDYANLGGARFDGANLWFARLDGANLSQARLGGANLGWARLDGANLRGARFDGADLSGAQLDGADLWRARLDGADLSDSVLVGADLTGAQLDGADLWRAQLEGANLSRALLDGALVSEASFDAETILARDWEELDEAGRDAHRQAFVDRGAVRSDLPGSGQV